MKLFDSELKLMELIWADEGCSAKALSLAAAEQIGWNKNTTYTVLKKLVEKGAVERAEPGFHCRALVSRDRLPRRRPKGSSTSCSGAPDRPSLPPFWKTRSSPARSWRPSEP